MSLRQPHHPPRGQIPGSRLPPLPDPTSPRPLTAFLPGPWTSTPLGTERMPWPRSSPKHPNSPQRGVLGAVSPSTWDPGTTPLLPASAAPGPGPKVKAKAKPERQAQACGALGRALQAQGSPRRGGGELGPGNRQDEYTPCSQDSSVQSLSHVRLFATPGTAARQASPSITNSRSLSNLMSIELVMPPEDRDSQKNKA